MADLVSESAAVSLRGVTFSPGLPRWRVVLWLLALTLPVCLLAGSYLAYTGSVATSGYEVQRLRAERDAWRTRNEQLRVELHKVRSLTWVEHEAVSRLQMQKPSQLTYLKLEWEPTRAGPAEPDPRAASAR